MADYTFVTSDTSSATCYDYMDVYGWYGKKIGTTYTTWGSGSYEERYGPFPENGNLYSWNMSQGTATFTNSTDTIWCEMMAVDDDSLSEHRTGKIAYSPALGAGSIAASTVTYGAYFGTYWSAMVHGETLFVNNLSFTSSGGAVDATVTMMTGAAVANGTTLVPSATKTATVTLTAGGAIAVGTGLSVTTPGDASVTLTAGAASGAGTATSVGAQVSATVTLGSGGAVGSGAVLAVTAQTNATVTCASGGATAFGTTLFVAAIWNADCTLSSGASTATGTTLSVATNAPPTAPVLTCPPEA